MSLKKKIVIVLISIVIYFTLNTLYQNLIVKDKYVTAYVLNNDVVKGDHINLDNLDKIKILQNKNYVSNIQEDLVFDKSYYKGNIVLNDMIIPKDEYIKINYNKEIISIKLNFSEDAASYQIEKGSIVNIYCSAKMLEVSNIVKYITSDNILSNDLESGYITFKLYSSVQIINCYNKSGNVVNKNNNELIDTILFEIPSDEIVKLNNLKNYAKFSISVIK